MSKKAEVRLDILIKKEGDFFLAHCLQFDIVTTADTLGDVRKDIIDLCRAHIEFSYEYDNLDFLFSPAPKEIWVEYLVMSTREGCNVENTSFSDSPRMNPFTAQEVFCYA